MTATGRLCFKSTAATAYRGFGWIEGVRESAGDTCPPQLLEPDMHLNRGERKMGDCRWREPQDEYLDGFITAVVLTVVGSIEWVFAFSTMGLVFLP